MNKELKEYLYMLVGKEFTRESYEKVLDYFNQLKQERDHYKNKTLDNLYMKEFSGEKVFCLEDDKETYRDMIFELQERIDRALKFMNYTFDISSVQDMFKIMNRLEVILKGYD